MTNSSKTSQPTNKNEKAKSINKQALISSVAESSGLSKAASSKAIHALILSIQNALKDKKDVRIMGFGTFWVIERKERNGHNPRTRKIIKIPASKHPKFRPGKTLKDAIA